MLELKKFEYFFLRYAPYPSMDDYVSFAVIMLEQAKDGFAGVRFMKSWRRLLCSHPDADLHYLQLLEKDIRERLSQGTTREELIADIYDRCGNSVQLSSYRECLAEDGEGALKLLARGAIDLPTGVAKAEPGERQRILRQIEEAFEAVGIWADVRKNIPVAEYTYVGDPLKIDVSYRPNGVIQMLQAVSLETSIDSVKALAFSYPQLVTGIADREKASASLTAIVGDSLDRADPKITFALRTLEQARISVAVTSELPIIVEKAKRELMA